MGCTIIMHSKDTLNESNKSSGDGSYSSNPLEICLEYLSILQDKQTINDTRNALIRYFVPSVGGPIPTAQKRRPIAPEEVNIALNFLNSVSLGELANSPDLALEALTQLDSAPAQRERVRRNLRELVDWARKHNHLPEPVNPIPKGICDHIKVGQFEGLSLKPLNALQIFEEYLKIVENHKDKTDLTNAVVRFFIPGCGGPIPLHKPARSFEQELAMTFLEKVPLEYLNEAPSIAVTALKAFDLTVSQGTLVGSALRDLIDWARAEQYLPYPNSITPWGEERLPISVLALKREKMQQTTFESYQQYCQYLQQNDSETEIASLQTAVVRYFVPGCGGPSLTHKRATPSEIQSGLDFLQKVPIQQLSNAVEIVEQEFDRLNVESSKRHPMRSRLRGWVDWQAEQTQGPSTNQVPIPEPEFNTFYTPGVRRPRKRPGAHSYGRRCSAHALCAKQFPNDYINSYLQKQLDGYEVWRRKNRVAPGSIKTEREQLLQLLGWLHRYEGVALNDLCFESMIFRSKLLFQASEYLSYEQYLHQKEIGTQTARNIADQDKKRVMGYLDFVGTNPNSHLRRLFIIISLAKFLYQDLLGSDDFPDERDIPIIRRLLDLQAELTKESKVTSKTVSYQETSVSWEEAVMAMEEQRRRAEQTIVYIRSPSRRKGYVECPRTDASVAEELQAFLSIALCIIIPSRSRTFYDLRLGETLKEGIVGRSFVSVQDLQTLETWNQCKDNVKFYVHHTVGDYKTSKSMPPAMLENGGWWAEVSNISFGDKYLYDYIRRWLDWGRTVNGSVGHNFFFRRHYGTTPIDGDAWNHRIKTIFERWTGVAVPPRNVRQMFTSHFPDYLESGSLLLQHSETMHRKVYDMRHTLDKLRPVMDANQQFIKDVLNSNR
jgi:hypothetical protein